MARLKDRISRFLREPPKKLLDHEDEDLDAYVRGPLFSRPVIYVLLVVFVISLMLAMDWIGLLLLNAESVVASIGPLNVIRVIAALMMGIAVPSLLLMLHYRRVYSYTSEENVFFAVTFSLSFIMGAPCAIVGIFG